MRAGPQLGVDAYSPQRITQTKPLKWQVSYRRQRLHSVLNACEQSFATLVLHATAKDVPWPTLLFRVLYRIILPLRKI